MRVYESKHMSEELKRIAATNAFLDAYNGAADEVLTNTAELTEQRATEIVHDVVGTLMKLLNGGGI